MGKDSADIDEMFGAEIDVSKSESVFFCPHISASIRKYPTLQTVFKKSL
jgi:hypothetical protein